MRPWAIVAFVGWLAGCSCKSEPSTALMVEVDSDLDLAAVDRVRLEVASVTAPDTRTPRLDTTYSLAARDVDGIGGEVPGSSKVRLPIRIAVLPRGADDATIHLSAEGLPPGLQDAFVTASSTVSFVPGRTLLLRMFLSGACAGASCEEGQTCVSSQGAPICAPEEIDRPECVLPDFETGSIESCAPIQGCTAEPGCCGGACVACCGASDCPDDGNECTGPATCERGFCVYPPRPGPCADDGDDCTQDVCVWDACSHSPIDGCP